VVGVGARRGVPAGRVVSFGVAGALHEGIACGDVLDATRVVDAAGNTLWEGGPLGAPGARVGTILAADRIVDDPEERRALHERTGADAVDMESGPLARAGALVGCLRSISDTPARTLGPLAEAFAPDGHLRAAGVARALVRPRKTGRALDGIRRALRRLEEVAA
jgi:nucleoside phosphorylase